MPRTSWIAAVILVGPACGTLPKPHPTPAPITVAAGFDATWNATIDHFAEGLIPIGTLEKASGLIVTDPMILGYSDGIAFADCGTDFLGTKSAATLVRYNVRVKGDTSQSMVGVTALFVNAATKCYSWGNYELELMRTIKVNAEATRVQPAAGQTPRTNAQVATRSDVAGAPPPSPTVRDSAWVGSRVDQVFYRSECAAAKELAPANRRYFRSEDEAIAAGYRRSRVPGC